MVVNSSLGGGGGKMEVGELQGSFGGTSFQFVFTFAAFLLALAPPHHTFRCLTTACFRI